MSPCFSAVAAAAGSLMIRATALGGPAVLLLMTTALLGFLMLVARKYAVTQVVGYLMLDNGVFIFGQSLAGALPVVVEVGILLDLLVAVFVMGIAIHHISREFDHIDTRALASLRD